MIVLFNKKKNRVPIKMWVGYSGHLWWKKPDLEKSCIKQLMNLSNLPFIYHHVAEMPDGHTGYGMPIGGVIATENVVIPHAVGSDIGCGMGAIKTSLIEINRETLKKIMGMIRKVIPVGRRHHKEKQNENLMPYPDDLPKDSCGNTMGIVNRECGSALRQLGTLGSGNHFIEIQKGSDGYIWIMVHSGSRNLGYRVAEYYDKVAIELNKKWHSAVPKKHQLAFLPLDSKEGQDYIKEMNYCLKFAFANRQLMLDRISFIFDQEIGCAFHKLINIHHNYAVMENHFGKNVMVHRKGATLAREGTIGIIPGSRGRKSYIVRGKGNPESFMSCSHGAGRTMSRTKAKKNLNLQVEMKRLDDQGIVHDLRSISKLDEADGAYKDITKVMQNQNDLVDIKIELTPLGGLKG